MLEFPLIHVSKSGRMGVMEGVQCISVHDWDIILGTSSTADAGINGSDKCYHMENAIF